MVRLVRRRGDRARAPLESAAIGFVDVRDVSTLTTAHLHDRELTETDIFDTTAKVVPLSKTMRDQVEHIRK